MAEHLPPPAQQASSLHDRFPASVSVFVVGAQKCGTTSLAYLLGAHPDVRLAAGKEAHLFDDAGVQATGVPRARLEELFGESPHEALLMDATPSYLYLPGCMAALARHNPSAKIIMLVRDPADRTVSHYYHSKRHGAEKLPLLAALLLEPLRLRKDAHPLDECSAHRWHSYRSRSRFGEQLAHLLEHFAQAFVIRLERLAQDPRPILDALANYLEVDAGPLIGDFQHLNHHGPHPPHRILKFVLRRSLISDTRKLNRLMPGNTVIVQRESDG